MAMAEAVETVAAGETAVAAAVNMVAGSPDPSLVLVPVDAAVETAA